MFLPKPTAVVLRSCATMVVSLPVLVNPAKGDRLRPRIQARRGACTFRNDLPAMMVSYMIPL